MFFEKRDVADGFFEDCDIKRSPVMGTSLENFDDELVKAKGLLELIQKGLGYLVEFLFWNGRNIILVLEDRMHHVSSGQ